MSANNLHRLRGVFALCAGLSFTAHALCAEEQPAQVSAIETFLTTHNIPKAEGLADLMQRTLFRTARDYYRPLRMDDLERDAIEGMRRLIEDAPADLAKVRQALADAQKNLDDRTGEKTALGDAAKLDPVRLARLNDAIIEARETRDAAADVVKKDQDQLTITPEKLLAAGLDTAFHELDPHSDYLPPDSPLLGGAPPQKAKIGILAAPDGPSKYILTRGLRVQATLDPQDSSPAAKAGVLPGDLIESIDGVSLGWHAAPRRGQKVGRRRGVQRFARH